MGLVSRGKLCSGKQDRSVHPFEWRSTLGCRSKQSFAAPCLSDCFGAEWSFACRPVPRPKKPDSALKDS